MMRNICRILLTGFFVIVLTLTGLMPLKEVNTAAYAEGEDEAVTYTVFIYSGKEGTFADGTTVKKIENLTYRSSVTVSLGDLDLQVKNPDQYYVRGLKLAGHDNDELSSVRFQSYTFDIKEDMSFSVSYGMAGGMVKYTVNYQDENGNSLHPSESFYGMAGDKPVVAYRHVEGYLPDSYNLAKTLTSNESQNVFTFTYHRVYDETGTGGGTIARPGEINGGTAADQTSANRQGSSASYGLSAGLRPGGSAAGTEGQAAVHAQSENDGTKEGAGITDLDDEKTPTTGNADQDQDSSKGSAFSGLRTIIFGIIAAGVIAALIILYFLLFRKDYEGEE